MLCVLGSDCNLVIDSEALAANATKQDNTLVIGAAAGGIGGALLLICPVLLLVVILCCCCKARKNTEEPHPLDDESMYCVMLKHACCENVKHSYILACPENLSPRSQSALKTFWLVLYCFCKEDLHHLSLMC